MEHQDVTDQHRPDHVDRFTAPRTDPDDPGRAHRATARDAGRDRARGRCGRVERPDRPVAGDLRGHRPQVASPLVRGTGCGVAGRCEAIGSPTEVHCRPSRPGQGDGLHATTRTRGYRCRGGRARSWPNRRSPTGFAGRYRRRPSAGGCREDALKPWQYQSWIFITDPDFAVKAQRVLDLYDRTWDGKPLGATIM